MQVRVIRRFICYCNRLNDLDAEKNNYNLMAISLNYRSDAKSKKANATVQ